MVQIREQIETQQVNVISSGGFLTAYEIVLPDFETTTGIKVTTGVGPSQGNTPDVIGSQLHRGVPADVVIMSREGLDELIAEGRILRGSDVNLAQTPLGVGVRMGTPIPDIRTVEAFKQTLLRAKSVAFPESTTGSYQDWTAPMVTRPPCRSASAFPSVIPAPAGFESL